MDEEKEIQKPEITEGKKQKNLTSNLRENPWILSTVVLAVFTVVLFFGSFNNTSITGNVIAGEDVAAKLLDFYASNGAEGLELDSIEEISGLYQINFLFEGNVVPIFVTMDGKYAGSLSLLPDENTENPNPTPPNRPEPVDVPKLDKPVAEIYVMSMCPYGTQALKGILPVAELLGDKIDLQVKFVSYAMHGKEEMNENTQQYCIQKEEPNKFYSYLNCYLKESGESKWEACMNEVGINKNKIESCIVNADREFQITQSFNDQSSWLNGRFPQYNVNKDDTELYGVGGSPTFVLNGVKVDGQGRDSVSFLSAICSSFTTAPEECATQMDSASPAHGFGWEGTGSASDATCG